MLEYCCKGSELWLLKESTLLQNEILLYLKDSRNYYLEALLDDGTIVIFRFLDNYSQLEKEDRGQPIDCPIGKNRINLDSHLKELLRTEFDLGGGEGSSLSLTFSLDYGEGLAERGDDLPLVLGEELPLEKELSSLSIIKAFVWRTGRLKPLIMTLFPRLEGSNIPLEENVDMLGCLCSEFLYRNRFVPVYPFVQS